MAALNAVEIISFFVVSWSCIEVWIPGMIESEERGDVRMA
jgi:hypothetical protein